MDITLNVRIDAPPGEVRKCWTSPEDIVKWNSASDDWHTPRAGNDLREGWRFNYPCRGTANRVESDSG